MTTNNIDSFAAAKIVAFQIDSEGRLSFLGEVEDEKSNDTIYTRKLIDCNQEEFKLILNYTGYVDYALKVYADQQLESKGRVR